MIRTTGLVEDLKRTRDELRLEMHLGSMELKEQWDALEKKWESFAARARLRDTTEEIEESLRLVGAELTEGYEKIRAALASKAR